MGGAETAAAPFGGSYSKIMPSLLSFKLVSSSEIRVRNTVESEEGCLDPLPLNFQGHHHFTYISVVLFRFTDGFESMKVLKIKTKISVVETQNSVDPEVHYFITFSSSNLVSSCCVAHLKGFLVLGQPLYAHVIRKGRKEMASIYLFLDPISCLMLHEISGSV